MSTVIVVSAAVRHGLRLGLVARRVIDGGVAVPSCLPSEITRERTSRTMPIGDGSDARSRLLDRLDHRCAPTSRMTVERFTRDAVRRQGAIACDRRRPFMTNRSGRRLQAPIPA